MVAGLVGTQSKDQAPQVIAGLDYQLPPEVTVGSGTVFFVGGWCFATSGEISCVELTLDGRPQAAMGYSIPRLDVFESMHPELDAFETGGLKSDPASEADPSLQSYRSGFWGLIELPQSTAVGVHTVGLSVSLDNGTKLSTGLGEFTTVNAIAPLEVKAPSDRPLVAIAMATFNPTEHLFRRQIESIRAQTETNWVCVISDDCSLPAAFKMIEETVGDDERFVISRSPRRLGFYHNFERALSLSPTSPEFVAMADQDDYWQPQKLELLVSQIGDATLVYSDARIVDESGAVIADTYWSSRKNNHSDLISLLTANSVTGAAALLRRDLLDQVLPFPPGQFSHFHDHWIALVALALGDIAFVDGPLYDYTQHAGAVLGHEAANRQTTMRSRLGSLRRDPRGRVRQWRNMFFVDGCRLLQFATVIEMRCAEQMSPDKRRLLERFLTVDSSYFSLFNLGLRGVRDIAGKTETFGAERGLFYAFAWRRMVTASARAHSRPQRRFRLDALPPRKLDPKPGAVTPPTGAPLALLEKVEPLRIAVSDSAPKRINILIPTIDLKHFFGGYIAKFNLALALARRGHRVRIITVDPVGVLAPSWKEQLQGYEGLGGVCDQVEITFGREAQSIEVSNEDSFIATTWWTAHIANQALSVLGREGFLYLIQEYEPFTFPMGSYAASANQSYEFAHKALFSSELLRSYFRLHEIGVFAAGPAEGDRHSLAFENAITAVCPPTAAALADRQSRRLLMYARPEPHAARNMFEMAVLGLRGALDSGCFGEGWELHGIGSVGSSQSIDLGGGQHLKLLPRSQQSEYSLLLPEHDVGLALMYTPHPSLVPIEMASAGMLTVTNSFENKTAEALALISPNLLAAKPTVESIAATLRHASDRVQEFSSRASASNVAWSSSWTDSFDDAKLSQIEELLGS